MEEENTHILTEKEYNYLISDIKTKENIINEKNKEIHKLNVKILELGNHINYYEQNSWGDFTTFREHDENNPNILKMICSCFKK